MRKVVDDGARARHQERDYSVLCSKSVASLVVDYIMLDSACSSVEISVQFGWANLNPYCSSRRLREMLKPFRISVIPRQYTGSRQAAPGLYTHLEL